MTESRTVDLAGIKELVEVYDVKAGRVLSKANEGKLRAAAEAINSVLEGLGESDEDTRKDAEKALDAINAARVEAIASAQVKRHLDEQDMATKANELAQKMLEGMNRGSKMSSVFEAGNTKAPSIGGNGNKGIAHSYEGKLLVDYLMHQKHLRDSGQMYTKAMSEGTNSAGGFMVAPDYMNDAVAEMRRAAAPLLNLLTTMPVQTNVVYIPRHTGALTTAWTAENVTKTSSDEVFGQITVNIYTVAGIAKVSNQLLADSRPTVDAIIRNDMARGIELAKDLAVINGSGSGQPLGILGTSGIGTQAIGSDFLGDAIIAGISTMRQVYYGEPNAIVMHPRDYNKLVAKKTTTGEYVFVSPGNQGIAGSATSLPSFMGLPIVIDHNVPTNLGAGTNETRVIIGNFREGWLFERDNYTMDVSDVAGTAFADNQTWFRGEQRVGFTAARQPTAFHVITGLTAAAGV